MANPLSCWINYLRFDAGSNLFAAARRFLSDAISAASVFAFAADATLVASCDDF